MKRSTFNARNDSAVLSPLFRVSTSRSASLLVGVLLVFLFAQYPAADEEGEPFSVKKGNDYAHISAEISADEDYFEAGLSGNVMQKQLSFFEASARNSEGERIARIGALGHYYTLGEDELKGSMSKKKLKEQKKKMKKRSEDQENRGEQKVSTKGNAWKNEPALGGFGVLGFGCTTQVSVGPVPVVLSANGFGLVVAMVSFPHFSSVAGNLILSLRATAKGGPGVVAARGCEPIYGLGPFASYGASEKDKFGFQPSFGRDRNEEIGEGSDTLGEASVTLKGRLTFFEGSARFTSREGTLEMDSINFKLFVEAKLIFSAPSIGPFSDGMTFRQSYKRKLLETDSAWEDEWTLYKVDEEEDEGNARDDVEATVWSSDVYRGVLQEVVEEGSFVDGSRTSSPFVKEPNTEDGKSSSASRKLNRDMVNALRTLSSRASSSSSDSAFREVMSREIGGLNDLRQKLLALMKEVSTWNDIKNSWLQELLKKKKFEYVRNRLRSESDSASKRDQFPESVQSWFQEDSETGQVSASKSGHVSWLFPSKDEEKSKNLQEKAKVGKAGEKAIRYVEAGRLLLGSSSAMKRLVGYLSLARAHHYLMDLAVPVHGVVRSGKDFIRRVETNKKGNTTMEYVKDSAGKLARSYGIENGSFSRLLERKKDYSNWVSKKISDGDTQNFLVQSRLGARYASNVRVQDRKELGNTIKRYMTELSKQNGMNLSGQQPADAWKSKTKKRFAIAGKYIGAMMEYALSSSVTYEEKPTVGRAN